MSNNEEDTSDEQHSNGLRHSIRRRLRAVAEREASRLARPERPGSDIILPHASKSVSAVSSTPSGISYFSHNKKQNSNRSDAWCGPFSVARQMIAEREEARIKRENEQNEKEGETDESNPLDYLVKQHELEKKRKAHPSMNWRGNIETITKQEVSSKDYYAKRRRRYNKEASENGPNKKIKSLFQLCVDFLVTNFEYVDSLGSIDGTIRNAICEELIAQGKFNGAAFEAIVEEGMAALELVDCAKVTQDQLCDALRRLIPGGLQAIILNHSGRCFGAKAVQTLISTATSKDTISKLFALSVGGAYVLNDSDAADLIQANQVSLSSIEFKACPNLGIRFCTSIANNFSSILGKGILYELSLENISLSKETLLVLSTTDALRNLKNLKMQSIAYLDDEVVHSILKATSSKSTKEKNGVENQLEGINFSENAQLTDAILSDIRSCNCNGQLKSLELCGLKNLTNHGLEAFFTLDIPGMPRAPLLRKLNLSDCHYDSVTDNVVKFAATASSMKISQTSQTGQMDDIVRGMGMGLSTMGGLVYLNVSGSSITDDTLEVLSATSVTTLKELNVSFCCKISDRGLGYLIEKVNDQLQKIHVWGCAQLTDELFDGHTRVEGSRERLEIIGAWMKKSGGSSVR